MTKLAKRAKITFFRNNDGLDECLTTSEVKKSCKEACMQ